MYNRFNIIYRKLIEDYVRHRYIQQMETVLILNYLYPVLMAYYLLLLNDNLCVELTVNMYRANLLTHL